MNKVSEKMISFSIMVTGKGQVGSALDPGQELDGACHAINDQVLNEGTASQRKVYDDKKKNGPPDDRDFKRKQQYETI